MTDYTPSAPYSALTTAPTLTTDRLVLRGLSLTDFDDFAAMWAEPYVVKYILGTPSTRQESWMRLLGLVGHWECLGMGYWVVTDRHSGAFLGAVGFGDFLRPVDPPFDGIPEAGWTMTEAAQGKGFAFEAVTAVLAWADAALAAPYAVCMIDPANAASLKLAGAVGFGQPHIRRYKGEDVQIFRRDKR